MARRVDLNRIQKTYPYIRRKPVYRFIGETKDNAEAGGTGDENIYSIHELTTISSANDAIQQEELSIFDFGDGKTGLFGFSFNVDQGTNLHEVAVTLTGISDVSDAVEVSLENSAQDLLFEFDASNSDYIIPKA
tara:strand:+ start:94 stop:495 length:402 start_codon:yes stop_codon:yes gene_type:complete